MANQLGVGCWQLTAVGILSFIIESSWDEVVITHVRPPTCAAGASGDHLFSGKSGRENDSSKASAPHRIL